MTYKEFEKEIEKLGASCRFYEVGCNVYVLYQNTILATISKTQPYHSDILFNQILTDTENDKLLTLCCKLMRTPIDERGELE